MTYQELANIVGKRGSIELLPGVTFAVTILDGRMAYGRQDILVEPVEGEGAAWVSAERVKIGKGRA